MKVRKSLLVVVVIVGLLAIPTLVGVTFAQGITYESGIQIQNLSDTETANIVIAYYNQSDGTQLGTVTDSLSAGGSKTYFPVLNGSPNGPNVTSFNGSAVISSDQPVAAIANTLGNFPSYGAATGGFSSGSTTVNLPLIMCNNSGFDTWFNVQNAGTATASVSISFTPGSAGNAGVDSASIEPGAAKTFDQTSGSSTTNCSTLADASGKFIGSATVTSSEPLVASVMQLGTGGFNVLMGYNGFTGSSTGVNLPLVMSNNGGFYTGIQVQNVGAGSTSVTIDYSANIGGSFAPANEVFSLAAGESKTFIQNGGAWGSNKYVGGATVTSTSEDIVAIVNQVFPGPGAGPFGTAYQGFDTSAATTKVTVPLLMSNNSGFYTGIQVQNVGGCDAPVTIDYSPNTAGSFAPANEVFTINGGESKTVIQTGGAWGTNKYIGGATITSTGCDIVAIVNQVNTSLAGDVFFTYNGFNQ